MSLIQDKRLHFLMERFSVLPFRFGCASQSSVDLGDASQPPKHTIRVSASTNPTTPPDQLIIDGERTQRGSATKNSFHFLTQGRRQISNGMQRLIRSIKSFSQLFVYKEEEDTDEKEAEIEIGFPTDVKHVTHFGLDGSTTTNKFPKSNHLNSNVCPPPELVSLPSISLEQFELAMAAQMNRQRHHSSSAPC